MAVKNFVAAVELSEALVNTISRLARRLEVSESEVVTSSVKLMEAVERGTLEVTPREEQTGAAAEPRTEAQEPAG